MTGASLYLLFLPPHLAPLSTYLFSAACDYHAIITLKMMLQPHTGLGRKGDVNTSLCLFFHHNIVCKTTVVYTTSEIT